MLRFLNEVNEDLATAPPGGATPKERKDAAAAARQSRSDARKWGCSWAQ